VDQMHLTQVRLRRVARDAGAMLHGRAAMRSAIDALPGGQSDAGWSGLPKVCDALRPTATTMGFISVGFLMA